MTDFKLGTYAEMGLDLIAMKKLSDDRILEIRLLLDTVNNLVKITDIHITLLKLIGSTYVPIVRTIIHADDDYYSDGDRIFVDYLPEDKLDKLLRGDVEEEKEEGAVELFRSKKRPNIDLLLKRISDYVGEKFYYKAKIEFKKV